MHRIIWTNPMVTTAEAELADDLTWDSRDMAQLAAVLRGGPSYNPWKYRSFRIESGKQGAKRG